MSSINIKQAGRKIGEQLFQYLTKVGIGAKLTEENGKVKLVGGKPMLDPRGQAEFIALSINSDDPAGKQMVDAFSKATSEALKLATKLEEKVRAAMPGKNVEPFFTVLRDSLANPLINASNIENQKNAMAEIMGIDDITQEHIDTAIAEGKIPKIERGTGTVAAVKQGLSISL